MITPAKISIHDFEAREYLDLLLQSARRNIREALNWKRNYLHLGVDGYTDYLGWAKRDADKARYLAKRLKIHFGRESFEIVAARKAKFTAALEQRRAA